MRDFFQWPAGQPGYKSRITYADTAYFSLSLKETRVAKFRREPPTPTIEQIQHVIQMMPAGYRHRASQPGADRPHAADQCAGRSHRLLTIEAC
jgi:hypothetical protein